MAGYRMIAGGLVVMALFSGAAAAQRPGFGERLRELRAARQQASADVDGATRQTLMFAGRERSYALLDAHKGGTPAPLVIVLHGGGGNGSTMLPRWADKARSEGLVVAAPDGVGRMQGMGTWNAGGCCGEAMTSGLDDVAFVNAVVDDITRKGGIDTRRIYVAGFSNGGMLTHRFAIAHGDRIAAAAVVSGAMFGDEKPAATPVPMLIMHGRKDNVVGYDGGMSPTSFIARAQSAPFLPVERTVAFWRDADGCRAAPAVTTGGDVTGARSLGCSGGSEVLFYSLASAGHGWPGDTRSRGMLGNDPYTQINATEVIWDFFKVHRR